MINLDDMNAVIQSQGGDAVLRSIDALPEQLKQSFDESLRVSFPDTYTHVRNVLVCGMGGSRFTALIVKELFKEQITVPYAINDDYLIPHYVGPDTLVILSSYSGTTEEIIQNGKSAYQKKALLAGVAAGGEIVSFLKSVKAPVYEFNPIHNPSGQPRIGFGYGVGGHMGMLANLGLVRDSSDHIASAINALPGLLNPYKLSIPKDANPAKRMAQELYGTYPYYIVSEFLTGVGNAVANQTNETAKSISSFRVIPELNHHLMEGLKFPPELQKIARFVFFLSRLYSPKIQKRFSITKEVVEQNHIKTITHELKGKDKIEQAFELMGFGSYLSMYLATLYGQDPTSIPFVNYFKKRLKE